MFADFDSGVCCTPQIFALGTINFSATSGTAVKLPKKLPKGYKVLRFIADVTTAFNAGTTNTLVVGTSTDDDAYLTSNDVTAGTKGSYLSDDTFLTVADANLDVYAKYTQAGTAATAGSANIYVEVVRVDV